MLPYAQHDSMRVSGGCLLSLAAPSQRIQRLAADGSIEELDHVNDGSLDALARERRLQL